MAYMKDSSGRRLDGFTIPRGELVHAETNQVRVVGSTTVGAIPGLDITVTVEDRPVRLTGTLPYATAQAAPTTLVVTIQDVTAGGAGVEIARFAHDFANTGTNSLRPITARIPAGSGVRRYQLRAGLFSGTNAVDLGIASTRAATFRAEEV